MARPRLAMGTRHVVPRFWDHDELAELEHSSGMPKLRLTMIGLWAASDALGRFEWRPKMLAAKIYPYHPDDQAIVEPCMELYAKHDYLLKYEVEGKWYGAWPHWGEHNDFRKGTSEYPAPPGLLPRNPRQSPLESESRKWNVEGGMKKAAPPPASQETDAPQLKPAAAPVKTGFDPFSVKIPGVSPEEVSRVAAYWWKFAEDGFWRTSCRSDDFFIRNFEKMTPPYGWQSPKEKTPPRTADSNCEKCHGAGGYPVDSDNPMYKRKNGTSLFKQSQVCECLK